MAARRPATCGAITNLAAEGLTKSPDGTLVATGNMRGTAFPLESPRFQSERMVTLLTFNSETGSITKLADYPFSGVLPEGGTLNLKGIIS